MKNSDLKKTTQGMRIVLYVASFLVLSVGQSLYLLTNRTDVYFSWTINPPLTAAFLGAGYLASFPLELFSARERIWAHTRPAVPGVWVFTFLTLIVTLIHLDRFHFNSLFFITRAGTWVWLGVYIFVPIVMGILWLIQMRQPGIDPPRKATLPVWMRAVLIVQGGIMLLLGGTMLVFPERIIPLWPWMLSPLTARAIGAWGVGIGVLVVQALWENDWWRLNHFAVSYLLYGLLQMINLLRYPTTIDWSRLTAGGYTAFVLSIILVGAFGTWSARQTMQIQISQD